MNTVGFFFADQNGPFLVAAVITLAIAAIEILSVLMGLGISDLIDDALPDIGPAPGTGLGAGLDADLDVDVDADIGADPGAETPDTETSLLGEVLAWLNVGRVPFLVLLVAFLTLFTTAGYGLQLIVSGMLGIYLPSIVAAPAALAAALPATRWTSRGLGRLVPRDESYATGNDDLVGRIATITLGPVTRRAAGKAKVADQHGNLHFVRVRAANRGDKFPTEATVLLVGYRRSLFDAIAPPSSLSSNQTGKGN